MNRGKASRSAHSIWDSHTDISVHSFFFFLPRTTAPGKSHSQKKAMELGKLREKKQKERISLHGNCKFQKFLSCNSSWKPLSCRKGRKETSIRSISCLSRALTRLLVWTFRMGEGPKLENQYWGSDCRWKWYKRLPCSTWGHSTFGDKSQCIVSYTTLFLWHCLLL